MIRHKKVDVVTIGAGWTASILAWKLTAAGLQVVSIEQGPARWTYPDFAHNHDHLRFSVRKALMADISRETWTWRPNPSAPSLPMRKYGSFDPGAGLGGAGIHWSGMHWRFLPSDFRYRSHHVERYGEKKLPEGNQIQDWPLTYEDLEPYYDAFEYDVGVSGQAGNIGGQIVVGGNPFEGPRRRDYPLPPLDMTLSADLFAQACQQLGYHPFPQAAAILSQDFRDPWGFKRWACLYCGFCTRFGCDVDAKASPINSHLRPALLSGRYEVRIDSKVLGVNLDADGLATGVTYVDADGQEHEQPADIVVLSAYMLTNVRLLLLSKHPRHPKGIGNDRGWVGRNYTYQHWQSPAIGLFDGRRFNGFMGNTSTVNVIYDFNADCFDHADVDFVGGASIFCGVGERDPLTSVANLPALTGAAPVSHPWGAEWKRHIVRYWDSAPALTMQGESLPYSDQFCDLDPVYTDHYGLPLLRLTFDWHPNDYAMYRFIAGKCADIARAMGASQVITRSELQPYNLHRYQSTHNTGGAIMGTDPGCSVTNKFGQVWDTPNVFVTGAALYPQNPGANPTGTLCALAYMQGDAICDRYVKDPRRLIG